MNSSEEECTRQREKEKEEEKNNASFAKKCIFFQYVSDIKIWKSFV